MDTGWTFMTDSRRRISVYMPEGWIPPIDIEVFTPDGELRTAFRIQEDGLECRPTMALTGKSQKAVMSSCNNWECHRREPGVCQCGRHDEGVRIWKATE